MKKEYLFHKEKKNFVLDLVDRYKKWEMFTTGDKWLELWRKSYQYYYGRAWDDSHSLGSAGEQGEFTTIHIGHLRNVIKHQIALITQTRLSFDCVAINSDLESANAAKIGNMVLDQLFYEKGFEKVTKAALEMSLIFGTAFVKVCWNPYQKIAGKDGANNDVYAGAPKMIALSPMDVLLEPHKDDFKQQNWVVTREKANKWDLIAENPELEKEIENLPKIRDIQGYTPYFEQDEDTVWLYKAYHKSTPAMPKGRYTVFCSDEVILKDDVNPYCNEELYSGLPVFCIRPDIKYGGAYGHTVAFDLLPIQESLNIIDSQVISMIDNHGIPNVVASRNFGADETTLPGGFKLIEGNPDPDAPNGGFPQSLNLLDISTELVNVRESMVGEIERISGINSSVRGDPKNNLTSATAVALTTAAATTFNSNTENAYVNLVEETASFLLCDVVAKFMKTEELLARSGKNNAFAVSTFSGDRLKSLKSAKVQVGNPLSRNLAGKMQVADTLLNAKMLKSPSEYMNIILTGQLERVLETETIEDGLVALENEDLSKGIEVITSPIDDPIKHILGHRALAARPEVRRNSAVLAMINEHILEHIEDLRNLQATAPEVLAIILGQPLPMPQPAAPEQEQGGAPQLPGQAQPQQQMADVAQQEGGAEQIAQAGMDRALEQEAAAREQV